MDGEPPRRPPERPNHLFRHKTYHGSGPGQRKRGREVLEDITYIVNEARNWRSGQETVTQEERSSPVVGLGILDLRISGNAADPGEEQEEDEHRDVELEARADGRTMQIQEQEAGPSSLRLTSLTPQSNRAQPSNESFTHQTHAVPLPAIITNFDQSSSPPSSPSRPALNDHSWMNGGGSSNALVCPPLPRTNGRSLSPSLRAPPTLSRRASSSSLIAYDSGVGGVGMRRIRTHPGVRTTLPSPTTLERDMSAGATATILTATGSSLVAEDVLAQPSKRAKQAPVGVHLD